MTMEPGIYFGLPESDYHADPAFSASGAKNMLISPLTYWINSPLNPDHKEEDTETDSKIAGKAFHTRILEGQAVFDQRYAIKPDPDDYPEAIAGGDALRKLCESYDLKKSGSIAEMCERILEVDPIVELWPVIIAEFEASAEGRIILKSRLANEIKRHARIVEMHEDAKKAFVGGFPEVSIFWIDTETGIRMKARVDYLKVRAAVDLKTFANQMSVPLEIAVGRAVANYRYHIQGVVYCEAVERAKEMYRAQGAASVFGESPEKAWLDAFAEPKPHAFVFVFLESGNVPNAVVREFRQTETYAQMGASTNNYWSAGFSGYRLALDQYKRCTDHYEPGLPWVDPQPMRPFVDEDFPIYMME